VSDGDAPDRAVAEARLAERTRIIRLAEHHLAAKQHAARGHNSTLVDRAQAAAVALEDLLEAIEAGHHLGAVGDPPSDPRPVQWGGR
jgi:hypothetical protein